MALRVLRKYNYQNLTNSGYVFIIIMQMIVILEEKELFI